MNRRHMLLQLSALAGAAAVGTPALAQGARFAPVNPPQPTAVKGKVEVIKFFHYGCPHCRDLDPLLEHWVKQQAEDVNFLRVPAIWGNAQLKALAQFYYAAEATGDLEAIHSSIFPAIQDDNTPLFNEEGVAQWVGAKGLDVKRFIDAYKSFGVQSKVQRADQLVRAYRINGVPTLAIDGKWTTSASMAGSHEASLKVADELVMRARKEQGRA